MKKVISVLLALVLLLSLLPTAAFTVGATTSYLDAETLSDGVYSDAFYMDYQETKWFAFTALTRGTWSLKFNHEYAERTNSYSFWRIQIFASDEEQSLTDIKLFEETVYTDDGAYTTAKYGCEKGQTFYIKVSFEYSKYQHWAKLKMDFNACNNWETEPNNTYYTADTVALGKTIYGHSESSSHEKDWYQFTVPVAGTLKLKINHNYNEARGYWSYCLYKKDSDGLPQELENGYVYRDSGKTLSKQVTKGAYYLQIQYHHSASDYWYSITPTLTINKPTKMTAKAVSTTAIKASWSKVKGVSGYQVYNKTTGKKVTVKGTSYTFKGLKAGKAYKIYVRAYKKSGSTKIWSSWRNMSVRTKLAVPTVKVSRVRTGIKSSWNKVTGAAKYEVYRRTYSGGRWGKWKKIKTTTSRSYMDKKATKGRIYSYAVKAVRGSSKSGYKSSSKIKR